MNSDHRSHQIGLDADLWFTRPGKAKTRKLSRAEREDLSFPSLVDEAHESMDETVFDERHVQMLKLAAESPEVARIFVSYVIKGALCSQVQGDRRWLRKIRPWWGHTEHFHVRLHCPKGDTACEPQGELPDNDGCGAWPWFTRAEVAKRAEANRIAGVIPEKRKREPRPRRCWKVLRAR